MSILTNETIRRLLDRNSGPGGPRLAVFDCDGTLIKGDVGEAMLYYQLEHFLFRCSPASVWPDHPDRAELEKLYQTLRDGPENGPERPDAFARFSDMILDWYFGQIDAGSVSKACADIVRLFAGFSLADVRDIARDSFLNERSSPVTSRTLGKRTLPLGIRYIRETVELLTALREHGFLLWAVSGSNRWSVEPVFAPFGVPSDRVVGIELRARDGILIPDPVQPVPIRQDKVAAMQRLFPDLPVLVASDSKNDIPLLLYSSDVKVRINSRGRDTGDFFRTVGSPPDSSWVLVESPTIMDDGGECPTRP